MSKNVRIDNEFTERVFNGIDKIRTNEVGGGTIDWIPQGEYKDHINKGTLEINENGTYFASEYGYDSFSEVTVQIGDGLGQTELDDGTEIDTGIEYQIPEAPEVPNITYTDEDIDIYYPQVDYDPVSPEDVPLEIPDAPVDTITTNTYKGPGTITGIDPDTGDLTSVSTDPEGNIVKNILPFFLEVTIPEGASTIYHEGETIDFSRYIYTALRPSGQPFIIDEGAEIPNEVPFSELEFPITVAHVAESLNENSESSENSGEGGSFEGGGASR